MISGWWRLGGSELVDARQSEHVEFFDGDDGVRGFAVEVVVCKESKNKDSRYSTFFCLLWKKTQ